MLLRSKGNFSIQIIGMDWHISRRSRQSGHGFFTACDTTERFPVLSKSLIYQSTLFHFPFPIFIALAAKIAAPEITAFLNQLPNLLFFMVEQFRITKCKFCEAIRLVHVPKGRRFVSETGEFP